MWTRGYWHSLAWPLAYWPQPRGDNRARPAATGTAGRHAPRSGITGPTGARLTAPPGSAQGE